LIEEDDDDVDDEVENVDDGVGNNIGEILDGNTLERRGGISRARRSAKPLISPPPPKRSGTLTTAADDAPLLPSMVVVVERSFSAGAAVLLLLTFERIRVFGPLTTEQRSSGNSAELQLPLHGSAADGVQREEEFVVAPPDDDIDLLSSRAVVMVPYEPMCTGRRGPR
jgi:hypothetical protein